MATIKPFDESDGRLLCPDARETASGLYSCPAKDCAQRCPRTSDEDIVKYKCLVT